MKQRTLAALVALPLLLLLVVLAFTLPLPYATYAPGLTVDVLGESEKGEEIIEVSGHEAYRDDGEVRMTTVFVSLPEADKRLPELLGAWLDDDEAVYPYEVVHPDGETVEDSRREGAVDMVTSQDEAIAVALTEMGEEVEPAVGVAFVEDGTPADGALKVRDLFLEIDGKPIEKVEDVAAAVRAAGADDPVELVVLRDGRRTTIEVTPKLKDGTPTIGITVGTFYRFPFQVSVDIDPAIGGPSAGLMFALAIYDTLTPGSLTGGETIAGTGTIDAEGRVGPIGGVQQKIAGARADGAGLFLVPPDNCAEALGAEAGDMRLVRAETMHDARLAVEAWAEDPNTELPSCEAAS
ncbi:YlbL family protein [Nocardioides dongkuii]|uniref:YlbL family protein n=1 Tax=Nocardioides dongkuii TaxID=2760089 RepID=UPI0015FD8056|nr:PDZ domain-containing protein [Nocardioides dongkuii]